jgi:hypothetical protein
MSVAWQTSFVWEVQQHASGLLSGRTGRFDRRVKKTWAHFDPRRPPVHFGLHSKANAKVRAAIARHYAHLTAMALNDLLF